jgi:cytochrome c
MLKLAKVMVLVVSFTAITALVTAQDKAKYSISDIMTKCMKSGLCGKVAGGKATPDEVKTLVEYYESLPLNKPPKGDAAEWKKKTEEIVKLTKAVQAGDKDAGAKLKAALNCAACHKLFKG